MAIRSIICFLLLITTSNTAESVAQQLTAGASEDLLVLNNNRRITGNFELDLPQSTVRPLIIWSDGSTMELRGVRALRIDGTVLVPLLSSSRQSTGPAVRTHLAERIVTGRIDVYSHVKAWREDRRIRYDYFTRHADPFEQLVRLQRVTPGRILRAVHEDQQSRALARRALWVDRVRIGLTVAGAAWSIAGIYYTTDLMLLGGRHIQSAIWKGVGLILTSNLVLRPLRNRFVRQAIKAYNMRHP